MFLGGFCLPGHPSSTDHPHAVEKVQRIWGIPTYSGHENARSVHSNHRYWMQSGRALAAWQEPSVTEEINISTCGESCLQRVKGNLSRISYKDWTLANHKAGKLFIDKPWQFQALHIKSSQCDWLRISHNSNDTIVDIEVSKKLTTLQEYRCFLSEQTCRTHPQTYVNYCLAERQPIRTVFNRQRWAAIVCYSVTMWAYCDSPDF
jgi:hypothetical protein